MRSTSAHHEECVSRRRRTAMQLKTNVLSLSCPECSLLVGTVGSQLCSVSQDHAVGSGARRHIWEGWFHVNRLYPGRVIKRTCRRKRSSDSSKLRSTWSCRGNAASNGQWCADLKGEHRDSLPLADFSLIAGNAGDAGDGKIAFLLASLAGMMSSSKMVSPGRYP